MQSLPLWFRKFLVDAIETGIAAVLAVAFFVPQSVDDATRLAAIVGAAVIGALVSAFRRAVPELIAWLREQLAVEGDS